MSSEAVDVKGSKSHRATPGEWSEEIIAEEDGDIACTNRVFECSERGWDMDETYRQSTLYCLHVSFLSQKRISGRQTWNCSRQIRQVK
jgi:hypothetical protein